MHKRYVDVFARFDADGTVEPVVVCWVDGRSFPVDEVLEAGPFGPLHHGKQTMRYRVRFGGHETDLYLERTEARPAIGEPETLRWWVYAFDRVLTSAAC